MSKPNVKAQEIPVSPHPDFLKPPRASSAGPASSNKRIKRVASPVTPSACSGSEPARVSATVKPSLPLPKSGRDRGDKRILSGVIPKKKSKKKVLSALQVLQVRMHAMRRLSDEDLTALLRNSLLEVREYAKLLLEKRRRGDVPTNHGEARGGATSQSKVPMESCRICGVNMPPKAMAAHMAKHRSKKASSVRSPADGPINQGVAFKKDVNRDRIPECPVDDWEANNGSDSWRDHGA